MNKPSKTAYFLCAVACQIPSAAAIDHACLEWRIIRALWLDAIAEFGLTEDQAREMGRAAHAGTRREMLS